MRPDRSANRPQNGTAFAERDVVEFVLDRRMEPRADAIGLRAVCLGPGMIHVFNGQIKLIGVVFDLATVLDSAIRQDPQQVNLALSKERNDPVVQQVGGRYLRSLHPRGMLELLRKRRIRINMKRKRPNINYLPQFIVFKHHLRPSTRFLQRLEQRRLV